MPGEKCFGAEVSSVFVEVLLWGQSFAFLRRTTLCSVRLAPHDAGNTVGIDRRLMRDRSALLARLTNRVARHESTLPGAFDLLRPVAMLPDHGEERLRRFCRAVK